VVHYPSRTRQPQWVHEDIAVVAEAKAAIDSLTVSGLTSDRVVASLRPVLTLLDAKRPLTATSSRRADGFVAALQIAPQQALPRKTNPYLSASLARLGSGVGWGLDGSA
jgi:hypothetical protein